MNKTLVTAAVSIFVGLSVLHLVAFNFISGGVSLPFVGKIFVDFIVGSGISLPIYWLFFSKLKHISLWKKVLLHILVFFIYIILWYEVQLKILLLLGILKEEELPLSRYWDYYFAGLYYIVFIGSYQTYQFFSEKKRLGLREHELLILNKTSEINMLKAQIRPHFLFNTLNSIGASIPPQHEKTRVLITLLADTFRYSLKASINEYVFLSEELDFIEAQLLLEKERFAGRLQYEISIGDNCKEVLIAPLLIQPLVENAIEHGITPVPGGGYVKIEVSNIDQKVQVRVSNSGAIYRNELAELFTAEGIGLKNLKDRLKQMYDSELKVSLNSPNGLIFQFSIPAIYRQAY